MRAFYLALLFCLVLPLAGVAQTHVSSQRLHEMTEARVQFGAVWLEGRHPEPMRENEVTRLQQIWGLLTGARDMDARETAPALGSLGADLRHLLQW